MADNKISSIVILDDSGMDAGIITDRDLREKVVAGGMDINRPVSVIMSSPLIKAEAEEQCFETLLRMMRFKIHHILVVDVLQSNLANGCIDQYCIPKLSIHPRNILE